MLIPRCVVCSNRLELTNRTGRCYLHGSTKGDFPPFVRNTCVDCGKVINFCAERCTVHAKAMVAAQKARKRHEWCPPERERQFQKLRRVYGSAKARRLMQDKAEKARLATMTPFEQQLERVRNGAAIFERQDTSRAYGVTLGGVSSV